MSSTSALSESPRLQAGEDVKGDLVRHLQAAEGYIELGMCEAAADELEGIAPEFREIPFVFSLRFAIYSALEKWSMAEAVARHMVVGSPTEPELWSNWAYATRRATSVEAAQAILLDAEKQHPQDATIQFNLGCYASVMGEHVEAKRRVSAAIVLDGRFRAQALDDPDLQPLWDGIAKEQDA